MRKMLHMFPAFHPTLRFLASGSLVLALGATVAACGTLIGNPGDEDTSSDVGGDVGTDTSSDAGQDTAVMDTTADVSPDVVEDAAADTGADVSEDVVPSDTDSDVADVLLDGDVAPDGDVNPDTDLDTDPDSSDADVTDICDPIAAMGCDVGDCVVEDGEALCGLTGTAAVRESCEVGTDTMELSCVAGASCLSDDFGAQCRRICTGDEHCTSGVACHRAEAETYGTCGCLPFYADDGCNEGSWCANDDVNVDDGFSCQAAGAAELGAACEASSDCAVGSVCRDQQCESLCEMDAGDRGPGATCGFDTVCHRLPSDGVATLGTCRPPL